MSRLTRDGTAEPVSRDQILRRERGQGNIHFSCSADHVQDWQSYTVDPYSCYVCGHTLLCGTCLPEALVVIVVHTVSVARKLFELLLTILFNGKDIRQSSL